MGGNRREPRPRPSRGAPRRAGVEPSEAPRGPTVSDSPGTDRGLGGGGGGRERAPGPSRQPIPSRGHPATWPIRFRVVTPAPPIVERDFAEGAVTQRRLPLPAERRTRRLVQRAGRGETLCTARPRREAAPCRRGGAPPLPVAPSWDWDGARPGPVRVWFEEAVPLRGGDEPASSGGGGGREMLQIFW